MKLFTSYFYQIRFFKPYMIPLSTAMWDPKWFHNNKNQSYVFLDKNNVYNGLRIDPLVPGNTCNNLCRGPEKCLSLNPNTCQFLVNYRAQLDQIDCDELYNDLENLQSINHTDDELCIVFIFHETPNNPCSERRVVQEWFRDNGYSINELNFK